MIRAGYPSTNSDFALTSEPNHSYLGCRKNGEKSLHLCKDATVRCGGPQGSVLVPLLSLLLINVLHSFPLYSRIKCYADDSSAHLAAPKVEIWFPSWVIISRCGSMQIRCARNLWNSSKYCTRSVNSHWNFIWFQIDWKKSHEILMSLFQNHFAPDKVHSHVTKRRCFSRSKIVPWNSGDFAWTWSVIIF